MQRAVTTDQAQLTILIVDDDPAAGELLVEPLRTAGYGVELASDGRAALALLRHSPADFIFVDMMMPGMSGVETLQQLKVVRPRAMIFVITGHSAIEGMVSEALWTGVDGVLYRPFEASDMVEMVARKRQEQLDTLEIDLKRYTIAPEVLKLVSEEMARKYTLLPLMVEDETLVVAMADPGNLYAIEDLRVRCQLRIRPMRVSAQAIQDAFAVHFRSAFEIERQIQRISSVGRAEEMQAAERLSADVVSQTPIARSIELMIRQAVRDRASDIHLEPQQDHLRVRYRIDGVLHDVMTLPKRVHAPLLSRIKVLSKLNIAERRRPQDGQFSVEMDDQSVDIRVATIDTVEGEMAVLRVLDKSISVRGLDELGFLPDTKEAYERLLQSPWGIILMSGPTGSGKTSSLYASINKLDKDELKIITIEDPVEYRFGGISQVQVNRQAGITFATGLRAAMRLDPNAILVGEIRDQETANTAVQASLTGHLVLSSIHANDTVGAILRLVDLGVEPFLVTSSLLAVVSQRLVRRVCPECRTEGPVSDAERRAYAHVLGEERETFIYGKGCSHCADTGYRGRVAVLEMLVLDDQLRRLVLQNANADEIRRVAEEGGMRNMLRDGMLKAREGVTTVNEVLKNIFALSQE
jgi:general secretion pathway protein E